MQHKYFIKGMVCDRCIITIKESLRNLNVDIMEINLGEVTIIADHVVDESLITARLEALGFTLLQNKKLSLVKSIKNLVEEVYSGNFEFPYNFRFFHYASEKLNINHDAISDIFMRQESISLEMYIINYRINKIKELLVYTDKKLADIAFSLGFSSVAHLSAQFKNNTGLNPSYFRQVKLKKEAVQVAAKR